MFNQIKNFFLNKVNLIITAFIIVFITALTLNLNKSPIIENHEYHAMEQTQKSEFDKIIKPVNDRCRSIKNIQCNDLTIKLHNVLFSNLHGKLFYEKDNCFRLFFHSFLADEVDIGSNKDYFWFLSNRYIPRVLHYSEHKYLYKTGLKNVFNPNYIKNSLGIDEIIFDGKTDRFIVIEDYLIFYRNTETLLGDNLEYKIIIDLKRNVPIEYMLSENGMITSRVNIVKHELINNVLLPKVMVVNWVKEGYCMTWTLNELFVNTLIDSKTFNLPHDDYAVNMAVE